MRGTVSVPALLIALALAAVAGGQEYAAGAQPVETAGGDAVGAFYDALLPYGSWVYGDTCGWVWYPYSVSVDWRPYTNGRWTDTDDGWMFSSYDPWGWAVYHYGRWYYDNQYGWAWCPGLIWAPSYVAWRRGDDYIGWAPIPPGVPWQDDRGFVTTGLDYDRYFPASSWCFVPYDRFLADNCDTYLILPARNVTIFPFASFFFDIDFDRDHRRCRNRFHDDDDFRRRFESRTGHRVDRFPIRDMDRPGMPIREGNELRVFRPDLHTREGRQRAAELPLDRPTVKPPELSARQEDQRRVLEEHIRTHRGMLERAQQEESQQVPKGHTADEVRSLHEKEARSFEEEAAKQRGLLGRTQSREDRIWMAPQAPQRQRFSFEPPATAPREAMPTAPEFPRPVFEKGPTPGIDGRLEEGRGGETRGGEARGGSEGRAGGESQHGGESRGEGGRGGAAEGGGRK